MFTLKMTHKHVQLIYIYHSKYIENKKNNNIMLNIT
jgi:hypothetical protein